MIVGKNVRYLSADDKSLCSLSADNCKQPHSHTCCHETGDDWTTPFDQCLSMSKNRELGAAPTPTDAAFHNNHTQLVGLRRSDDVEERRQQQEGAVRGGRQDAPVSCHMTNHPSTLEARLKSKFNTVRRGVIAMKRDLDVGDDDPYAFTDVDVKPADIKPTLSGPSVVPPVVPVANNCQWNDLLVKMATRPPGVSRIPVMSRAPAMPRAPGVSRIPVASRVPSMPHAAPTGPTAIAKLYPELAEKLEPVRTSKSDSMVTKGSLNKSSRTMNRLQTKIAQNKLKDRLKRNKSRDRTIASRNSPQPITSVITSQPITSVITPQPITFVNANRPIASVITPQPIASMFTPQPIASMFTPQPITSVITPQPIASVITPQPITSVITPQTIASMISPTPFSSVISNQPIASMITPQPIASVISPTPFSSLLATMERAVIAGVPTANLLLSEACGDSLERTTCPTVANHHLCSQLTSHIMPPCINVMGSGDMPRSSREITQVAAGSTDVPARCRKSISAGGRKKRCAPNKRKTDAKSIGSQRRNRSAAWKKKLGIVDIPPCNTNSLQMDIPATLLPQKQLPLIAQPLPRLQLPMCDLPLPNYVTSAGLDTKLTIPPQPSPFLPGHYQNPLMFPPPISSLPSPLFPPVVPDCFSVATSPQEAPLAFTCIRQRKSRPSSECSRQVKGRLHDSGAVDLYMRHTECRRRSNRVLPVGVDSSDDDSDSGSDLDELPWQREWVVTSSDDDNEDDDLDYGIPSAIRNTKVLLLRSKLRRQFHQMRRCCYGNAAVHNLHNKELQRYLLAARRSPASTASALLEIKRVPGTNQTKVKQKAKPAPHRRCLQKEDDDDTACGEIALPYANHCLNHIMYNVDQQMFGYCTAKFSDNTQCCTPVFDVKHELPLCPEHAAKADNYQKNQGVKPKKPRKKTKPSALTRPPKKGKKKKNQKRHSRPQKPSPPSEPVVSEESPDLQSSFTVDVEGGSSPGGFHGSSPGGFQSDELEKEVEENLGDSTLDHDMSDELGTSFSPGVIDKNLLPLDSEQATRFLDEALDIFSGKNGEFLPSREEAEALEQALAVASEDIYAASESIEQMSHDSAVTMAMLTDGDELTKQIADSLMSPHHLSSATGSVDDDLGADNLNALARSISVSDLKSLSQSLTTSDLNSALDEASCGVPRTSYAVYGPEMKPMCNNMTSTAHLRMMAPIENQGAIFLPIMSTSLQPGGSVVPLTAPSPFYLDHPPHHMGPPVYPVMPFPCGVISTQHPDISGSPNMPQNGMVWSSLGAMERTAMQSMFQSSLPPITTPFVGADTLQQSCAPKFTYPLQSCIPPGMIPPGATSAAVAMARFSASQFTVAPPVGTQTQPTMSQPVTRNSPQQHLYPNT